MVWVSIAGLIGLGGTASPALSSPLRFDCDSMDGAFSEIIQAQTGPNYVIRADVTAKRIGAHRDRRPNALIYIGSPDGKASIGVRLTASASKPQVLAVTVETTKDGESKSYIVTSVKLGETVHASIEINDGATRVEAAGQVAEIRIPVDRGAEVSASCATGQFMFEKLEMAVTS